MFQQVAEKKSCPPKAPLLLKEGWPEALRTAGVVNGRRASAPRRLFLGSTLPLVALFLIPKCPLCIAAYATLLGITLSVSTAAALRSTLIALSIAFLVLVTLLYLRKRFCGVLRKLRNKKPGGACCKT